jgi:hypothetical protein
MLSFGSNVTTRQDTLHQRLRTTGSDSFRANFAKIGAVGNDALAIFVPGDPLTRIL